MSQICPQCGNDLYATNAEHRCSDFVMPYMCKTTSIDPRDAQIAALTEKLRAVEAERDEMKRKYATQCAGSMSALERRIHLEADLSALRAELERKDAALKAQQAVVDAARALDGFNTGDCYEVEIEDYETLTAALENLRSDNDGK